MATATLSPPMTTQELLALPADGMDRWLIEGELREKPMTVRNRFHCKIMGSLTTCLKIWRDSQPEPRGEVLCGEAGIRLTRDPDTTVGVDIAYISPEVMAQQNEETTLIEGAPLLAVEILSPSDTVDEIHEKIGSYLSAGVKLIWIINPYDHTATIYQPDTRPSLIAEGQELTGDPVLPGFRVALEELFR